jgi:hypothetical protein
MSGDGSLFFRARSLPWSRPSRADVPAQRAAATLGRGHFANIISGPRRVAFASVRRFVVVSRGECRSR